MKMLNELSDKAASWYATILGVLIAIAQAGYNIDWLNFNFSKEWPKLLFSALIAVGGYLSTLKKSNTLNS